MNYSALNSFLHQKNNFALICTSTTISLLCTVGALLLSITINKKKFSFEKDKFKLHIVKYYLYILQNIILIFYSIFELLDFTLKYSGCYIEKVIFLI